MCQAGQIAAHCNLMIGDAARIDLKRVRQDHKLSTRMPLIGLPLAITAGTIVGAGSATANQSYGGSAR